LIARRIALGLESRDTTFGSPEQWLIDALGGGRTAAGVQVSHVKALRLIPVFSAIRIIASGVGSLSIDVFRGTGRDRREAPESWQSRLLRETPNPEQPDDVFRELLCAHVAGWGNAYAEKVKARVNGLDVVGELWPIYPGSVRVDRDRQGRKVFEIEGQSRSFTQDTILHVPGFGYDGLQGLSPIQQAKESMGVALAREQWQGSFYQHGAQPSGILSFDKALSENAAARLKARWDQRANGEVAVLEEGAKYQPTSIPPRDAQFIETMQWDATQVAALFRVPPHWIGGTTGDSLTYSTVEGEALHWVKFNLRPWLVRFEKALKHDRDLFPDGPDRDLWPRFNVESLLRGDTAARAAFYTAMRGIGALSINDIRDEENRPPVPGGDSYQQTPAGAAPAADTGEEPA